MPANIEHVIVLALENRSFDHLLGFLRAENPQIDGLLGTEFNYVDPVKQSGETIVSSDAPYVPDLNPGPGHDFTDVMLQLFQQTSMPNPLPAAGTNLGFAYDYAQVTQDESRGGDIMRSFSPNRLPALHALAQQFAVCDHWFSSLPGPTWPNRFFMHCATSGGYIDNTYRNYPMRTIFQNLSDKGVDWRVYYHDVPQSLALTAQRPHLFTKYELFSAFVRDCKNGLLPPYSFIEPRYFNIGASRANDQHPPHGVALGDALIADVYDALRASQNWASSLLLVVWDEHGGFYDHALPSSAVAPGDATAPEFDFTNLGVRVPAIVVSPFVPARTVSKTVYDHSSICATLKKIFDLPNFLTQRDSRANTFDTLLSLTAPRNDTPLTLPRIVNIGQATPQLPDDAPPTELHSSLLVLAESLAASPTRNVPANSEAEAAQRATTALTALRTAQDPSQTAPGGVGQ